MEYEAAPKAVKEVTTAEFIEMAQRCSEEIKMLRRINAELAPKADAYDKLSSVIDLLPKRSMGASEDLAWRLDKRIEGLRNSAQST